MKLRFLLFALAATQVSACKPRTASNLETAPRPADGDTVFNDPTKNLSHYNGPFSLVGKYALNPQGISDRYKLDYTKYGAMLLLDIPKPGEQPKPFQTPSGKNKYVRDMHYYLGQGRVGLRVFPVAEPPTVQSPGKADPFVNRALYDKDPSGYEAAEVSTANGGNAKVDIAQVVNGKLQVTAPKAATVERLSDLDLYIRDHLTDDKLDSSWDIFALTTYTHPDEYIGSVGALPKTKLQGGYSHMGGYFGRGRTRNSPFGYEGHKIWSKAAGSPNSAFPVDIVEVRFKPEAKVSRKLTNANTRIMNTILNGDGSDFQPDGGPVRIAGALDSVQFPTGGYEFDWFFLDSVANHLKFFAAWVDPTYPETLQIDGKTYKWTEAVRGGREELKTYCAEHITAALNLGFNLPFNLEAFQKAMP